MEGMQGVSGEVEPRPYGCITRDAVGYFIKCSKTELGLRLAVLG